MSRSVAKGTALVAFAAILIVGMLMAPGKRAPKQHPPNDDPWLLVNYNPNDKFGTYLGNGFISTRIMSDGVGSQDGKPLPCYMAGFYDKERLIPIPTWSDLRFYDGKTQFKIDKDADYKQVLNMRTGILTTYATWRAGRKTLKGKIEVIVSRDRPNLALIHAAVVPDFSGSIVVSVPPAEASPLLKAGAQSGGVGDGSVFLAESYKAAHSGLPVVVARRLTCSPHRTKDKVSESGLELTLHAGRGEQADIYSYAVVLNEDSLNKAQNAIWRDADYKSLVLGTKSAWAKLWQSDIQIDGPRQDQQVIHSCMFYLLQSVREGSKWSIPPMGLSSDDYSGHIFWDADIWMFPALILQHPELAKSIVDYRYETLPGAIANAKEAGMPGAQYAWESGSSGKEATPEGLDYRHERHINGDVALAQWQYYLATGDLNWLKNRGWPVIKATADWWVGKAKFVPAKNRYEILRVCSPDESAGIIDNSAYTNAIAQMNLDIASQAAKLTGQRANPKWIKVASKLYIPFDVANRRFKVFDQYGSGGQFNERYQAKQADAELLAYPLQYQIPGQSMTDIYKNTLEFYAPRVHKGGPAMTSSAHSVIYARLGDCSKAYSSFSKSYKPYVKGPFNYFNEQPSKFRESFCFLTGAAGPIQAINFGLAGARMDYFGATAGVSGFRSGQVSGSVNEPKSRNTELDGLAFSPCLPKQWQSLRLSNVHWRGRTFDLVVTPGNKAQLVSK